MPLFAPVTTTFLPFMSSFLPLTTSVLLAVDMSAVVRKQDRLNVFDRLMGRKIRTLIR